MQENSVASYFPPDERVMNEREAAAACGIHVSTLRRTVAAGKGPAVIRLSDRRIGYRIRDLRAWLDAKVVS
jgi:predicted DNA-binding transcriptional regulator AlpA